MMTVVFGLWYQITMNSQRDEIDGLCFCLLNESLIMKSEKIETETVTGRLML